MEPRRERELALKLRGWFCADQMTIEDVLTDEEMP